MAQRPDFDKINTYQDFDRFYWYREELVRICRSKGICHYGNKAELCQNIKAYFDGNIIKGHVPQRRIKCNVGHLTMDTELLGCGFAFNQRFRDFFSAQTGIVNFKFNADMVATVKKVRQTNDMSFTLRDLLDIKEGKTEYAKYDHSSCQWNQFLKDFCADKRNTVFRNKLKVAAALWKIVRESTDKKVYKRKLVEDHYNELRFNRNK